MGKNGKTVTDFSGVDVLEFVNKDETTSRFSHMHSVVLLADVCFANLQNCLWADDFVVDGGEESCSL